MFYNEHLYLHAIFEQACETRVSNIVAFGSPWPIPLNQILNNYKYKLSQQNVLPMLWIYETVVYYEYAKLHELVHFKVDGTYAIDAIRPHSGRTLA